MKKALMLFALTCALGVRAEARPDVPGLIDAFGDIQTSDLLARLDNFAIELQNSPQSRGFIVGYAQANKFPGWPMRRVLWCMNYLVGVRGIDAARVIRVNGGFRDDVRYEFWVEPPGAEPPVRPFDLAAEMAREKSPYLFDRIFVFENSRGVRESYEYDYLYDRGELEPFAEALRSDPAARGLIVAYAERRDARGADRRLAARRKLTLVKSFPVAASRVVAVGGGRREKRTLELWIVPPGAEPPKPTPDAKPARAPRRRRR
jgi:hypothetical protein